MFITGIAGELSTIHAEILLLGRLSLMKILSKSEQTQMRNIKIAHMILMNNLLPFLQLLMEFGNC